MVSSSAQWERQALYEKVWQTPLRKLAAEYGTSDVALAKVCRKLQIPLPGLGHWTKIACGHRIPRPPLPVVNGLPIVMRQVRRPKIFFQPEDFSERVRIERIAAGTTPSVTKEMLAHPLIEKTKTALSGARTNNRGVLETSHEVDWLDLRVSKDCLPRALSVVALVIHMLSLEGFACIVEKNKSETTSAVVYDEEIRFGVIERSRQIEAATVPKASNPSGYVYNPRKLEPTGILSIEVWNYYAGGPQKVWRDRDRIRLEVQLPKCLAGMMRIALWQKARRVAREKEERARQTRIDKVAAELRKIEEEEKKIRTLKKEVAAWHRAQRIREYVAAVYETACGQKSPTEQTKVLEWVEWAERQADRIDPLKQTPPSIVDRKDEVVRRLNSVSWGW